MNTDHTASVRPETQHAWDAIQASGGAPSVRKVFEGVGGSYNVVAAECRVLRAEEPCPAAPPEVPEEMGASTAWDPPAVQQALGAWCEAMRTHDRTYRHYLTVAKRLQGSTRGLLTDILEAIRAEEKPGQADTAEHQEARMRALEHHQNEGS